MSRITHFTLPILRLATVAGLVLIHEAMVAQRAHGRDLDGRYANSPLKSWFESLRSEKGPCCSFADGFSIADVDWDMQEGSYRVRLDQQWFVVPDEALVAEPNRLGRAVVWPYKDAQGATQIRCFLPGAGT